MKKKIGDVCEVLGTLSNEHRLKAFLLLLRDELCVCELEEIMGMKQSRISHIMNRLSAAGLVRSRREGKWVIYSAEPGAAGSPLVRALAREAELPSGYGKKLAECRRNGPRAL